MNQSNTDFNSPEAVETAFYTAFADCDVQAMDRVWAHGDVVCVHPGSSALVGHEAIMGSWRNILTDAEPPNLRCEIVCRYTDDDLTVHVVEEHIMPDSADSASTSIVLATNIYQRDETGWHMVGHHASLSRSLKQHTLQ